MPNSGTFTMTHNREDLSKETSDRKWGKIQKTNGSVHFCQSLVNFSPLTVLAVRQERLLCRDWGEISCQIDIKADDRIDSAHPRALTLQP